MHEAYLEALLELPDAEAYDGLDDAEPIRHRRETSSLGNRDERPQIRKAVQQVTSLVTYRGPTRRALRLASGCFSAKYAKDPSDLGRTSMLRGSA